MVASPSSVELRFPELRRSLSPEELSRASAMRFEEDRLSFRAAHLLTRLCAQRLTGLPASELVLRQRCDACDRPHGRPYIAGMESLYVTLSRSRSWVAAAAATAAIGVDIEPVGSGRMGNGDLYEAVLTPCELEEVKRAEEPEVAFLRLWTCKEALVKVGQIGLDAFAHTDVRPPLTCV